MILKDIIEYKRNELTKIKKEKPFSTVLKELNKLDSKKRDFRRAVKREKGTGIHLIAEVKKASPSQGIIREDFNPSKIALIYWQEGADAISVLTDKKYFQGDLSYLGEIRKNIHLPLLRKDFIIDEYQLYESTLAGADAILLIVAALNQNILTKLHNTAINDLNLSVLVEVHTEDEAKQALDMGATIIGINNRDLQTFNVSLDITRQIRPLIPETYTLVSESGIKTRKDVEFLSKMGIDALLIGEVFMRTPDIGSKIKEMFQ